MGGPPIKPNEHDRKITKGRRQETTSTTAKTMQMLSPSNYKESNKRPVRGGNNHGSIEPHGTISRLLHKQYTGKIKTNEGNLRFKGSYARLIGTSIGRLQGRKQSRRGTEKRKSTYRTPQEWKPP